LAVTFVDLESNVIKVESCFPKTNRFSKRCVLNKKLSYCRDRA